MFLLAAMDAQLMKKPTANKAVGNDSSAVKKTIEHERERVIDKSFVLDEDDYSLDDIVVEKKVEEVKKPSTSQSTAYYLITDDSKQQSPCRLKPPHINKKLGLESVKSQIIAKAADDEDEYNLDLIPEIYDSPKNHSAIETPFSTSEKISRFFTKRENL